MIQETKYLQQLVKAVSELQKKRMSRVIKLAGRDIKNLLQNVLAENEINWDLSITEQASTRQLCLLCFAVPMPQDSFKLTQKIAQ